MLKTSSEAKIKWSAPAVLNLPTPGENEVPTNVCKTRHSLTMTEKKAFDFILQDSGHGQQTPYEKAAREDSLFYIVLTRYEFLRSHFSL